MDAAQDALSILCGIGKDVLFGIPGVDGEKSVFETDGGKIEFYREY